MTRAAEPDPSAEAPVPRRLPAARWELAALAVLLSVFLAILLRLLAVDPPFGHDESVYAVQARAWSQDTPHTGVEAHRAPLIPLLGTLVAWTDNEGWFRAIAVAFAIVFALGVWRLGRRVAGPGAALIGVGLVVAAPTFQREGFEFLTDIPAAALLVALARLLWVELEERDAPSRRLLWAAPLAAASFYVRYGSVVPVAALALTAAVVWRAKIAAHRRPALMTAALFVVLLVPHVIMSIDRTGTPWGILRFTMQVGGKAPVGRGLADYFSLAPRALAGLLGGAAMLAGVLGGLAVLARAASRRRLDREARAVAWLAVPAGLHVIAIGIAAHAEPRFVFFPVALLLLLGAGVGFQVLRRLRPRLLGPAVLAALALLAATAGITARRQVRNVGRVADIRSVIGAAGLAVRADAGDGSCFVFAAYVAEITWYSGCHTRDFRTPVARRPFAGEPYLITFEKARGQPPAARLEEGLALSRREPLVVVADRGGLVGTARVYRCC